MADTKKMREVAVRFVRRATEMAREGNVKRKLIVF